MAMTGMRQLAVGIGAIERTPPDAILHEGVPSALEAVPEHRRTAAIELAHWAYGSAAGLAFGLLPGRVRRWRISGPLYGVAVWGLFEFAIAPALGLGHAEHSRPRERTALLIDHAMFGLIVGAPGETAVAGPESGNPEDEPDPEPDSRASE
ncbi:hypothetical protein [Nocardiopsis sp. Huas11]|uniref:hypothetical protein n=1 Tax=Nocardiopsis sp. Huas11 TaxID=2183912 RepID=UPI000EB147E5|nr:hypothetical protein [Nocardiopsis sp. Huas11]